MCSCGLFRSAHLQGESRRRRFLPGPAFALLLAVFCGIAAAQTFKTPDPGPGLVPITGTWQFHTGDDLAWANPAFDDSGWQPLSAKEPWGAQGHSGYTGYAWYRKRIEVAADDQPLGIFVPPADGAYQVYWNGERVGNSGSPPPHANWYVYGQNAVFPLGGHHSTVGVLALRFWLPPGEYEDDPERGGLKSLPRLGRLALVQQQLQLALLQRAHRYLLPETIAAVLTAAGALLSLILFLRQRTEWLFLWVTLQLTGEVVLFWTTIINRAVSTALTNPLGNLGDTCSDIGLWLTLLWIFGLHRRRHWRLITEVMIGLMLAAVLTQCFLDHFWEYAGPGMVRMDAVLSLIFTVLALFPLFLIGFGLARQQNSSLVPLGLVAALNGAWVPLLDFSVHFGPAVHTWLGHLGLDLGEYHFAAYTLLTWLLILTLAFTVARRQLREGRRQTHLEQEMRSAKEVQHVLIPEEIPATPGLAVASVYKPAAEVGGDFFQVIPPDPDSPNAGTLGTLIVVGDVSGKGLKAAMTVSLIVGTVRTLAEATRSPAAILAGLNRRLLGRSNGGFSTCIVLRIDADGSATLANAGHLAPFRDGVEWDVPASLPLGLTADAEYDEVRTHLRESETLTLITDGVLEARNRQGELYGFERVAELMRGRPTAEQVADAACTFGQDDDITVVSIAREPARDPHPVSTMVALPALG